MSNGLPPGCQGPEESSFPLLNTRANATVTFGSANEIMRLAWHPKERDLHSVATAAAHRDLVYGRDSEQQRMHQLREVEAETPGCRP
jgi:hypothetical protein